VTRADRSERESGLFAGHGAEVCWILNPGDHVAPPFKPVPRKEEGALGDNAELRRLRDLVGSAPVALWEADVEGRFTYVSPRAEQLLGYPVERCLAPGFLQGLLPSEDHLRVVRALALTAATGQDHDVAFRATRPDGQILHLRSVMSAAAQSDGSARVCGVLTDVSAAHHADEETSRLLLRAEKAVAEAEAANRAKDEFVAMLSHELRAPLGSILIWTQLLRTGGLDEASVTRALGMIERSTETLEHFISDLLDVSRIIAGKFSIETRPVDLASVVEAAVEAAQPLAAAKSIHITSTIEQSLPPTSGDAPRLQQVVGNLVSNALKFTEEGTVHVTLDRMEGRARIRVKDTGTGIPGDFLPNVFDRFKQADSTSSRSHRGLGLGLAIVRHLVELHGGAVAAESPGLGQGSTFTVLLPLSDAAPMRAIPAQEPASEALVLDQAALRGLRVLLVDDEEDARESLRVLLERSGADVTAVGSAAEAIAQISTVRPHVLLSDIAMPEEDGYRLIRRVRELPASEGGRTPAAALTAYASREDRRNALLAGYQEHIPKPPDPAKLIQLIDALARR
jgi:PAS domain S-box-containing protein